MLQRINWLVTDCKFDINVYLEFVVKIMTKNKTIIWNSVELFDVY
jgi:hypothetical protein